MGVLEGADVQALYGSYTITYAKMSKRFFNADSASRAKTKTKEDNESPEVKEKTRLLRNQQAAERKRGYKAQALANKRAEEDDESEKDAVSKKQRSKGV